MIDLIEKKKIWLSSPHMGGAERKYVKDAFNTNWIAPAGPHILNFEKKLSALSNGFEVTALNSGTASLHLALILLGVKKGDRVLCSSFTFSASANPIAYVGASPVFIDSDIDSWNMCPILLEKAIEDSILENEKPKAIMLVHLYGMPAKIDEIMKIATKYDVPVIEDAAEALGSTYNDKPLGTFGTFGVYSFNGNKIITTSGGGALICKDKDLVEKAKFLATQARDDKPHYEHSEIGYNYRMSNICAAIGLGQLEVLEERILQKRVIKLFYKKELSSINEISFLDETEGSYSNFWLTTILLSENSTIDREQLRLHLEKENIESRPLWKPMHLQPVFKECKSYVNGVSEDLFNRGLCLPSGTNMSIIDLKRVVSKIMELYEA
jgi:dTDP-4-amino-4,6-dideoxygalactose transaminase